MTEQDFRERVTDYDELIEQARQRIAGPGELVPRRLRPLFRSTEGIVWAVVYDVAHLQADTRRDLGRACGLLIVAGTMHDHAYPWDA